MDTLVKKKRGRKPKNFFESLDEPENKEIVEKKKRGRKKKYEIENSEKILNRNEENNFDHSVAYSDDDEIPPSKIDTSVKKVAFGNLDITVSKKINNVPAENYRTQLKFALDENEYSSDEEKEIPIENIVPDNFDRHFTGNKKYAPGNEPGVNNNSDCVKRLRVVTTLKNVINDTKWPETTDTHCWWCCHQFKCTPCTLPTRYDPLRKRFTFTGIFCSWNCTKSYNFNENDCKKYERSSFITLLVQQMYGICQAVNIKAAPPRQCLKMFGGYLDIESFRNNSSGVDSFHLNLISYTYIHPEISEITNIKLKTEKKNLKLYRP